MIIINVKQVVWYLVIIDLDVTIISRKSEMAKRQTNGGPDSSWGFLDQSCMQIMCDVNQDSISIICPSDKF